MNRRHPKTALLLLDVINCFFDERGHYYHHAYAALRSPIETLAGEARACGNRLIHAFEQHRPGPDFEFVKHSEHCLAGSWEAEPVAWLGTNAGDLVVRKRRYSAFFGTDLDLLLREREIVRLVVAGVKSNVCVRATIQDAFAYGYQVLLPSNATASNRAHLHEASLEDVHRYLGRVVDMEEAVSALRSGTDVSTQK